MDHKETQHIRLYLLAGFLAAVLLVYLGVLYDTQVNHYDDYRAKSIRSIAREEKVEASRGIITDRNGRPLVTNRSTYNLTFDASLLKPGDDQNEAILRLVKLCQDNDVAWVDNLPVSRQAPFYYTVDQLSELQKKRFLSYLKDLEPTKNALADYLLQHPEVVADEEDDAVFQGEASFEDTASPDEAVSAGDQAEALLAKLSAQDLTAQLLQSADISPSKLLEWIRADFDLPDSFSPTDARLVLGVRYELSLRALGASTAYVMAEDITTEFISLVNDGNYSGAKVTNSSTRQYETSYAAHILGTVSAIYATDDTETLASKGYDGDDWIGRSGVEAAFEDYLRGIDGRRVVSVNSDGKITGEYYSTDPQPGNTVELTIDLELQKAVEDALAETVSKMTAEDGNAARGAGAAVIKVGTGEVLSLASYPTYDLSTYREDIAVLSSEEQSPGRPLVNRATQGRYSPGSTFKPLVAVAALEEDKVTLTEKINDPGRWYYPDIIEGTRQWWWNCWNRGGHGKVNVSQAITASCNTFFHEMGYRLGIEKIDEYALAFGLGKKTGIEIGDDAGLLAGPEEREARGGTWYGGDTVQAAIGQSDNLFTPIQLANYVATLVSGGRHYDAHLLKAVKAYDNSEVVALGSAEPTNIIDISDSTLAAVKKGMYDYTQPGGMVYSSFKDCTVSAGAKTGTVQLGSGITNNGVFVCFAPYDDPEIAVALVIEQGNSGAALASTAVNILNAYFSADETGAAVTGENQLLP